MATVKTPSSVKTPPSLEPVNRVEFNAAIIHFYRGELGRADHWRSRLDTTTNWAIITTAASMTFVFGNRENDAIVLLLVSLLVFFFLVTESRRYRHYDIWQNRLRLLETDYFAPMLMGYTPGQTWRDVLARDLQHPQFRISMLEAMGWRLRRNYIPIFGVLVISWLVKIIIHPRTPDTLAELAGRAQIGPVPAWVVLLAGVLFNSFLLALAITTRDRSSDEAASRHETRQRMTGQPLD